MIIKDKKLLVLLEKAGKLVEKVRAINKKIDDLENERNVDAIAHQKVKEETTSLVKPYIDQMGEFEDLVQVEIVLDADKKPTEDIKLKIVDRLEEWKRLFKEEKEKRLNPIKKEEPPKDIPSPYTPKE